MFNILGRNRIGVPENISEGFPKKFLVKTLERFERNSRKILKETFSEFDNYMILYGEILVGIPGEIPWGISERISVETSGGISGKISKLFHIGIFGDTTVEVFGRVISGLDKFSSRVCRDSWISEGIH